MPFRLTNRLLSIVLLTLVLVVTGCSGGGSDDADDGEPVSAATSQDISNTMTEVFDSVGDAMGEIQIASTNNPTVASRQAEASVNATLPCVDDDEVENGHVSLSATSDFNQETGEISFDATLVFEACDGISGTLTFDGDGTITQEEISFRLTLNTPDGSIEKDPCSLSMDDFTQTMTLVEATQEFALTIDGRITGSCAEESFTCTFDDDDIDISSPDAQTENFEASCRLS